MPASLFRSKCVRALSVVLALGIGGALAAPPAYAFGLPFHDLEWYMKHLYYRIGAAHVEYTGTSSRLIYRNPPPLSGLSIEQGPVPNTGSNVGDDDTIIMTQGFYIPKTGRHLALEFTIAPPLNFKFYATGRAANESLAPTALGGRLDTGVLAIGPRIGRFRALPPNFTLVYRPFVDSFIRPYIGAGAIWLYTYDVTVTNPRLLSAPGSDPELHFTKPIGCVFQAGFDVSLPLDFYITADVKYVGCADVDAKLTGVRVQSVLAPFGNGTGSVATGPIRNTAHFQSIIYMIGIGRTLWG